VLLPRESAPAPQQRAGFSVAKDCVTRSIGFAGNRELSGFIGTSVEQIDKTYGHLPNALDRTRQALDLFLATDEEAADATV
jgi:hypothetical protein